MRERIHEPLPVSLSSPGLYQSARVGGRNDRLRRRVAVESWRIGNLRFGAQLPLWRRLVLEDFRMAIQKIRVSMKKSDNLRCRYLWRLGRITRIARHVLCLED